MRGKWFCVMFGWCLLAVAGTFGAALPGAGARDESPVDVVVLTPGESRSLEFEFNGAFLEGGFDSSHVAFIAAKNTIEEILELSVNITPVGDVGSEVLYLTFGFVGSEVLPLKLNYGSSPVTYYVNVSSGNILQAPGWTLGTVFTVLLSEFTHFDFPLEMSMTVTLYNN